MGCLTSTLSDSGMHEPCLSDGREVSGGKQSSPFGDAERSVLSMFRGKSSQSTR
jgi:hypothetical protein